jgi:DHA2 family multidrug resistance protein-like MFS transporter
MIGSGFRSPRLVLIASWLAILSVGENSTAIMAALPAMTSELRLGPATVEWIVNAYLLASAVFIILGGEAADQFGAHRSSAVGIAAFALASLTIAVAVDGAMVVGARALQGVGAAFAVAGTLAAVAQGVPESDRARAIGAWTGFLMLGFSIGPLVGGAITHYAGWRVNFWLNVVAMLPAGLALRFHPGTADRQASRVDWLGLGLLAFFMVMLVHGLHALPAAGSAPAGVIVPLVLAAIAFAALLAAETRHHRPLLDFGLFRNRNFALACMLAFLLMFDIMALLLYYNLFAQAPDGLGMTAVAAGLSLMPLSVALFGFARTAPRLAVAVGMRRMTAGGSLLLALGCAVAWASLTWTSPVWASPAGGFAVLMLGLFVAGAGIALPYACAPRIGLAALLETQTGKGSGILNSCSFLGGTVGVTGGGIVFGVAGFGGVLVLVGLSALIGAGLCLRIQGSGISNQGSEGAASSDH